MKKIINIFLAAFLLVFYSCESWLTQDDTTGLSVNQAYSSEEGISSVAANLYSRLRYQQDFGEDYDPYGGANTGADLHDLARWDEASHNSAYWVFSGNVDRNYRQYYDFGLIRDINIHIQALTNDVSSDVPVEKQRYFLAEARYLRAFTYFTMVSRMGGVPIIEDPADYTETPLDLALPRNKESEVYDYIASELDEITEDLSLAPASVKTRATKGSALALKCRAMLYAGSIAYNYDKNVEKGLILPSGATGIEKAKADEYFQKCLDAYTELKNSGKYSLYQAESDLAKNYCNLFQSSTNNPEVIFSRDYDGTTYKNDFTSKAICTQLRAGLKTGCEINPVFNLVNSYEDIDSHTLATINPYNGTAQVERMEDGQSTLSYKVYDNPGDIFAGKDPRLSGTVIYPGSSFRGIDLDFQAGLAIRTASGYEFKTVDLIENLNSSANVYEGQRITGTEGPHRTSTYISHTGFLMRKFTDVDAGTEAEGASDVPYIVFRYGEVLLNAAEAAYCLAEDGVGSYGGADTRGLALELINNVRNRAGGTEFEIEMSELDFDRIINERRVELAFEDHRYNDLKRWRIADDVWAYDPNNSTSIMTGLWPYKIYAPGDPDDGKWIYRKVRLEHRGSTEKLGDPLNFDRTMFYATYPINEGNPKIEKNPNH
ncbi:RagB/SusD family nutrient uptake outer membrane protein [Sunxiuqinia sp. A32]|uniref:RagB/SusD family nutrient uptake outer membrane protein n=1 Tax=Sunxiuqinia sp. A32 TaxID=3461496 RepID=UPI00404650B5